MGSFEELLDRKGPILIDGGLATHLEDLGHDISGDMWSAKLLVTDPQAIIAAHRAYLDAGAQCIISASYQASRQGFALKGISAAKADYLMLLSVDLAKKARAEFMADNPKSAAPLVAASIGPYAAIMQSGTEYTGVYEATSEEISKFHYDRLHLLDSSDADLLACETVPSHIEARVLCDLLRDVQHSAWICFTCRDGQHISDGTPIGEVAAMFRDHPRVLAVGVNCTPPKYIVPLIKEMRSAVPDKAVIMYPNSGETYISATQSWVGIATPMECGAAAIQWRDAGADIIGGCCRMGPSHIRAMSEHLST